MKRQYWALGLTLALSHLGLSHSYADAVKWVDEKGRVHFGDRPPANTAVETEIVELKEAPKLGLTSEELNEQRKRVNDYRAELRRQEVEREQASQLPQTDKRKPITTPPTREECAMLHPNKTKDRVECFREAEQDMH
ncbi:DUF4124 domain-containing protein [Teredinibacter turnerae]|uniref:DUF4124 domain-containing protein n=1 Tax=Teredinibacter turnerae TaxID=2426 RepID=UPI0003F52A12|nr:DUF4124 domain-containing protein [Teredinibacter turnerae]